MGRKKSNARPVERSRKIHVNKYINQRGKTKPHRRSEASCKLTSKEPQFHEMIADQWPATKIPKQYGNLDLQNWGIIMALRCRAETVRCWSSATIWQTAIPPIITVIPMSSKLKKLELPVHIPVTWRDCEMLRDEELEESILLVEQITTIDKMVLCSRLCRVTSAKKSRRSKLLLKAVCDAGLYGKGGAGMMDIKNIPGKLKTTCSFCVWKFEKRNGQKTKMPYNPATGERAKINDLRTFSDFKNTLVTYAMGGYDGIGIAVGNGIGAFDIDHCIREDGTLNDTADTVLSIFPTAYVEKSPSGKGLRGFFCVPEDYVYDKTVYYINNRSKGLEVYMPGATNRFVTVTGDVYRTGEIPNDETAMTTLLDTLMKRNKQVQQTHFQHHSYLDDEAVIAHANEASNSDKFKKLYAGDWEDLYGSQSDADMALLSILAFWCGCDEEQMDRIFRTSGLMRDKWDRKQAGSTYGAISIRNTVNTCSAVYMPVNAQDIVDEEFSKLDEDDYIEFQPDLTKITVTLEEMAPHTNARYGRNEIGMGNMFADYFKQIARYNSERKGWYVYDGSVWRPDKGNLKVSELAKLLADKLYVFALTITEEDARKRFIDRVRKLQLRKNRETMLKDAMSVYPISMQAFDRNKYFFNCKNGTLDMRTLEFREHRPEDYLTMESGITYDPDADCPRWHSFIKEVMCGDADLADFLQRSLGYALTGDTSQECMFILYGATSRNGKGTAMETFLKIMGDYGKTSNPDMLAAKFRGGNTGGPSEEVARLVGSQIRKYL